MAQLGLEDRITDHAVWQRTVEQFRARGVRLPTLAQLADPSTIPAEIRDALADVDPDSPHPLNLFRVHWHNDDDRRGFRDVPAYLDLPKALTGVDARIAVALGSRFPMIRAHKVLAAFGCLVPRIVTGQFDPTVHRAVWPSTGNYCRGGIAISRILDCHGVAVLPEGMSQERFDWLDRWVVAPEDIIRTPGTESNVKEIYDECNRLDAQPDTVIFNQFSEFGNHLVHYACTGPALERVFRDLGPGLRLAAFTSATGSGGTIAAGDYLREQHGSWTVAVEALECPTLLYNGFGEHNIQGIGDKHVPLIHNVGANDAVAGVSDEVTDSLYVLLHTDVGRAYLAERRGVDPALIAQLSELGYSGIANIMAAIKTARYRGLGASDVIVTVATDHGDMYASERQRLIAKHFGGTFDAVAAGEAFGRCILGATTDNYLELTKVDRERIFNLGYYTWVEQQGVSIADFTARRSPAWWRELRHYLARWDAMIEQFNAAVAG